MITSTRGWLGVLCLGSALYAETLPAGDVCPGCTGATRVAAAFPAESFLPQRAVHTAATLTSASLLVSPPADETGPLAQRTCALHEDTAAVTAAPDQPPPAALLMQFVPAPRACFIAYTALLERQRQGRTPLVIDTRPARAYQHYRIPGSLNLPAYRIKTVAQLKTRPLLLVNEGYRYRELESTCLQLTQQGFQDVSILYGGLHAWRTRIAALQGDSLQQDALQTLPVQDFLELQGNPTTLIVSLANIAKPVPSNGPPHVILDPAANDQQWREHLRTALHNTRRPAAEVSAVIVAEPGRPHETIAQLLTELGVAGTFTLAGGWPAYDSYLTHHTAMLERLAQQPRRSVKCAA